MSTAELLCQLRSRGVRLWVDGSDVRFRAPAGVLNAKRLSELRARRVELRDALGDELSRLGPEQLFDLAFDVDRPEDERDVYRAEIHRRARAAFPDNPQPEAPAAAGSRFGCSHDTHWRSIHGVVTCATCHPPTDDSIVAEWVTSPPTPPAEAPNPQHKERK